MTTYVKASERVLIKELGTLNPPRCYKVNARLSGRRSRVLGNPIFKTHRPLKRLRRPKTDFRATGSACGPRLELRSTCSVLLKRPARSGLQVIAAALAGHCFPGCDYAAAAAWGLAPGLWVYVFCRIDRYEEGWRRNRGLSMLRRISRHRRLAPPIMQIRCSLIWPGTARGKDILKSSVRSLLTK